MMRIARIAAYGLPFIVWFIIADAIEIGGVYRVLLWIFALVAGGYIGEYVATFGLQIQAVPVWRTALGVFLLVVPETYCVVNALQRPTNNGGGIVPAPNRMIGATNGVAPIVPLEFANTVNLKTNEMANASGVIQGVEIGRAVGKAEAFNPKPIPFESRSNPYVWQTDPYNWEISFSKPGCTEPVIDTGLPLGPGNTYFIRTDGVIEGVQIGSVVKDGSFTPWEDQPGWFVQKGGYPIWGSNAATGKTLAVVTDGISNGRYQIFVRKSAFTTLKVGEIAPGVFTNKAIRW